MEWMSSKMRVWFWVLMVAITAAAGRNSAGPAEDLIEALPGQPKVNFKQYGGYVTIDERAGRALFYYFVEAENDGPSKPLTLWLNGGPGCSSIGGGAFTELGPFYPTGDGRRLRLNSQSWNKVSNLLFVESPAGVGWSYSNTTSDYKTGDLTTAKDMLEFLARWLKRFPEYASRDLYLTGESFAGHYVPQLAELVLKYNDMAKIYKFNLKGILVGNPLLSFNADTLATYDYLWSHGLISDESNIALRKSCAFNNTIRGIDIADGSKDCNDVVNQIDNVLGDYVDQYDVIIDVCPTELIEQQLRLGRHITHMSLGVDVCMSNERSFYFNMPDVQKALHANQTKLPYPWSMCSGVVDYHKLDLGINILPVLQSIIQYNKTVWIFSGDQDSVVPLLGSRSNVRKLAHDLQMPVRVPYRPWYQKGQVAGWTTAYGNFLTFATVRGAGHMVPFAQPARSLELFQTFLLGKDLPENR